MSGFVSLQGSLLVASPALLDPNFRRTVVLLTEHDAEAAMGVVLNRRLEIAVVDAVPVLADLVEDGAQVFEGGPVQAGSVLALADFCEPAQSASLAFGSVGYLRGDEDPAALVGDVTAVRVFSGYSGWGPGQLEAELEQEAWITLPAETDDVFGDPDGLWGRVLARKGGRYKLVASMPDDPSLN